jgi:putative membrane protein
VRTLVVCVDREGAIAAAAESSAPITGRERIGDLVTEVGLDDPEDSRVNCLLEALRVARDLDEEDSVVSVVSGADPVIDSGVSARSIESDAIDRGDEYVERDGGEAVRRTDENRTRNAGPGDFRDPGGPSGHGDHGDRRDRGDHGAHGAGSGDRGTVDADRTIARQVDALIARYDPDSAIVVIDSAEDERLVPIIESRVRVDAVDRVVVRQARDIESAYYLLKQFLADEELRGTVLVPIGIALLIVPFLLALTDRPATALAAIAGVTGSFLLYKGVGGDDLLGTIASEVREALYSGQVSIVTYVVAVGLALVGVFAGAIAAPAVTGAGSGSDVLLPAMSFVFEGVPWFGAAALVASAGRLLDETIRTDRVRRSSLNLPFGIVAVGLVVRGFAAYFLERASAIGSLVIPSLRAGAISVRGFSLTPGTRLAAFVIVGVLVSLLGVRLAARADSDDPEGLLD